MFEPYDYKFAPRHLPFMREQIWEMRNGISVYGELSKFEFDQIGQWIGSPKKVLEVGCGLGRGSIYLANRILRDADPLYILADRDGYTTNTGAFSPKEDEFYNDLFLTADFCQLNGLTPRRIFDTENQHGWDITRNIDLVFSLCSFGMHVAIERYIDRLLETVNPQSTMIFGTRGPYGPESFADRFETVTYVPSCGDPTGRFPIENWLILQNPKKDA